MTHCIIKLSAYIDPRLDTQMVHLSLQRAYARSKLTSQIDFMESEWVSGWCDCVMALAYSLANTPVAMMAVFAALGLPVSRMYCTAAMASWFLC